MREFSLTFFVFQNIAMSLIDNHTAMTCFSVIRSKLILKIYHYVNIRYENLLGKPGKTRNSYIV